jgi:hypothetical protein
MHIVVTDRKHHLLLTDYQLTSVGQPNVGQHQRAMCNNKAARISVHCIVDFVLHSALQTEPGQDQIQKNHPVAQCSPFNDCHIPFGAAGSDFSGDGSQRSVCHDLQIVARLVVQSAASTLPVAPGQALPTSSDSLGNGR